MSQRATAAQQLRELGVDPLLAPAAHDPPAGARDSAIPSIPGAPL